MSRAAPRTRLLSITALVAGLGFFGLEAAGFVQMSLNVAEGDDWLYTILFSGLPLVTGGVVGWRARRAAIRGQDPIRLLASDIWTADLAMGVVALMVLGLAVP